MDGKWAARLAAGARSVLREATGGLVALCFPDECRVCARALEAPARIPICSRCLDSFRIITAPYCGLCGRPVVTGASVGTAGTMCALCRRGVYGFDLARSYAAYDDALLRTITLLKHEAIRPLANWLGARLAEVAGADPAASRASLVAPVPLHPQREWERGFNQAELLARAVAVRMGLPLEKRGLERRKPRPPKLKLSRHERWHSARGAYAAVSGTQFDNQRVLLVDDVFTTGATLDACARALREAGAAHVTALTVARVVDAWTGSLP